MIKDTFKSVCTRPGDFVEMFYWAKAIQVWHVVDGQILAHSQHLTYNDADEAFNRLLEAYNG